MYEYIAILDRVVDGDTIDVYVDLGFKVSTHQRLRLLGIDAKERDKVSTEALKNMVGSPGSQLVIRTSKTGKYGRYLAEIDLPNFDKTVNQEMLDQGMATPYGG